MRINIFLTSLLFIIIIPGAYYIYIERISYSTGALISVLLIYFIYLLKYKSIRLEKSYLLYFTILILILVNSLYSMVSFDWFEYDRFILSYLMIWICTIGAIFFVIFSMNINDKKLYNHISAVFYIVLIDGIIFSIKVNFFLSGKPFLLFFPEMSHFSLIFLPLLLFKVLTSKKHYYVYLIISISLTLALTVLSLTLLVGTILVMLMYSIKKTFIFFLIPAGLILSFIGTESFSYFVDRISFIDTNNVSLLVFLSGWERAYLNLFEYDFLGIGFNQLGFEGQIGFFQNKLASLNLPSLNLKDGGSLAPKMISELGILGIVLISMYTFFLIKIIYQIKKYNLIYSYLDTFYASVFIMSFITIFLRGSGYFSPIVFLLLSSIIYFNKHNFNNRDIFLK